MRSDPNGPGPEPWHDPELPFLEVLEQEVRRRAERATVHHQQRQRLSFVAVDPPRASIPQPCATGMRERTNAPAPSRHRRVAVRRGALHGPARMARRSLTLMALLCLVGATAYGAREVFSGAPNPLDTRTGALTVVAAGTSDSDEWRLRLYMRGDELCRVLSVAETQASDCAPAPAAKSIQATTTQSPFHRYVFGVTGPAIKRVRVRIAASTWTVPTQAPSRQAQRTAGLPPQMRFYVETAARPGTGANPIATVEALSVAGTPLSKPVPSCLETGEPGHC